MPRRWRRARSVRLSTEPPVPPFLLRGLARGIDIAVHVAILEAGFRVSSVLPAEGLLTLGEDALLALDAVVGIGALVLCTAVGEWRGGATVGKLLTGLRTVTADPLGAPISLPAAAIRNLAVLVDGLLFGLVAYSAMARSPRRQRLGDRWGGTAVVWRGDAQVGAPWGVPVGVVAALALVLGSYLLAR